MRVVILSQKFGGEELIMQFYQEVDQCTSRCYLKQKQQIIFKKNNFLGN